MNKTKKKSGRPLKKIDWNMVERLCQIQCTGPEIASVLNLCIDTLTDACKREKKMTFSEYIKEKSGKGKMSLRRLQWESARNGNVTMQIWLGKQYLGQTEKKEISSPLDRPLEMNFRQLMKSLDDEK